MTDHIYKYPRLYLNAPFAENAVVLLVGTQIHYLKNVMRKESGDYLRVFNGQDGEWTARINQIGKKNGNIVLDKCFRTQPEAIISRHLYFSPIKKQRMDMLIEKSVELGVTDLHPVLMNRSITRRINDARIDAQIIEASEQSERLDIPTVHDLKTFDEVLAIHDHQTPFYACMERARNTKPISSYVIKGRVAFLIGPEGGFDDDEKKRLVKDKNVNHVSLGEAILRAETAAIACLSYTVLTSLCETEKN